MAQDVIGFIGAGNMAGSLVGGMVARGIRPNRIWMADLNESRLGELHQLHRVHTTTDNLNVAERADILVLAVKPQIMEPVCRAMAEVVAARQPLVISIAAGVTVNQLQQWLGDVPVVRCMPNTPALVQTGATGLFAANTVNETQKQQADDILACVGLTAWFAQERELDAVTAVSGSGPAYFFLMMEAMIEAAEQQGLDTATARQLVLQTALGAAQLAITSETPPATLRQQVTSPGGTTAAAIDTLEQGGYRDLIKAAVQAARARSEELAK